MAYTIRSARTSDVPVIRKLIDSNVESGRLLGKATVTLYEDVQEFCVAELSPDGTIAGCGALHVMWEDLAEIRTVAVSEDRRGLGIGHGLVGALLQRARAVGVNRVFVLTFAVDFFGRLGFRPISGTPVAAEVYQELLRSYDEGVAEFLDLERVKPNTLGNTRMLLRLLPDQENEQLRCTREEPSPAGALSGPRGPVPAGRPGGPVPAGRPGGPVPAGREDSAVWHDIAALTPPLVVCVAFLIGLAVFLRREMTPKRRTPRNERHRTRRRRS